MKNIDTEIVRFIREHHVMTLATCKGEEPYCANMFYAWMESEEAFVFTSSESTRHIAEVIANGRVAGSVVLETRVVGNVRGIQFTGSMSRPEGEIAVSARRRYLKRFPYASFMELELWILRPSFIKLTDNRLGFGKKIIWQKNL